MPDRRISLVVWEDATKKPPDAAIHNQVLVEDENGERMVVAAKDWHEYGDFERWCDPQPPGPGALTVEDLVRLHRLAHIGAGEVWKPTEAPEYRKHYDEDMARVFRLRRALDALGNGGTE